MNVSFLFASGLEKYSNSVSGLEKLMHSGLGTEKSSKPINSLQDFRSTCNKITFPTLANSLSLQTCITHPSFLNFFPPIHRTKIKKLRTSANLMLMITHRTRKFQPRRRIPGSSWNESWDSMNSHFRISFSLLIFLNLYFVG